MKTTFNDEKKRKERWEVAQNFEEGDRVPVLINVGTPLFCQVLGYTFRDYYRDLDLNSRIQFEGYKWACENMGDDRAFYNNSNQENTHLTPDIGAIGEGIVWNCEIKLPTKDNPWLSPWIIPKYVTPEEIEMLEVPDPKECINHLEKHYKKAFGTNIKAKFPPEIHPPCSAAGSLIGTHKLYIYLYKHKKLMHRFFEKLLKSFIVLRDYVDDIAGRNTTGIFLGDDHSGYLPVKMYREFVLPYNKRIYEKYGKERRGLHMDSPTGHIIEILRDQYKLNNLDLGWQDDIVKIKKALDGKVFFNGNMSSKFLVNDTFKHIEQAVEKCINAAAPNGGYFFDMGGETYAGIDIERLKYAILYAKKVGQYPLYPSLK